MNKTNIDWPGLSYTWNPITGCRRGCSYCYARRIHERFYTNPFSEIVYHEERLIEPKLLKKPSKIFVGSMSDIEYWQRGDTMLVLQICEECPQHIFMFLSKNPLSYFKFNWPKNTMQGLTMCCTQTQHCQQENFLEMIKYPRPYLSLEPLLGKLKIEISGMEIVIVGAMTGPGAIKPKKEWIKSVIDNVPIEKIYWKSNIRKYL